MEAFDLTNIEEEITDWWFSNNEEMDRFRKGSAKWLFKYGYAFYFESDQDQETVEQINGILEAMDDPSMNAISALEHFVSTLQDLKQKSASPGGLNRGDVDDVHDDEEEADWGEGEDDEEMAAGWSDEEYEDEAEEPSMQKQSSSVNDQIQKYNIHLGNKESIQLFKKSILTKNAYELKKLMEKHLTKLNNSFSVQIFEPLLMIKLTIDLNFLKLPATIYESLGFEMEELVEYLFIMEDNKLLMFRDDPTLSTKDLQELLNLGILKIEFSQMGNDNIQARYKIYLQMLHESFFNKKGKGKTIAEEVKSIDVDELSESKATLLDMGFSSSESDKALKKNKFSLGNAINYLLGRKTHSEETKMEVDGEMTFEGDPKLELFSNITTKDLQENSLLNYFRYILYSLDSIPDYCCICRDKLSTKANTIRC